MMKLVEDKCKAWEATPAQFNRSIESAPLVLVLPTPTQPAPYSPTYPIKRLTLTFAGVYMRSFVEFVE